MSQGLLERVAGSSSEIESLCREILERYEEVNLLYRLAGSLAGVFDAEEICWHVLQEAATITRAKSACVFLVDGEEGGWSVAAEAGEEARHVAEARGPILTDRPLLVDGEGSGRWSLLSVPMTSIGGATGQIALAREGAFTAGDLKLVTAIAGLAGVFIENGRLAHRMQENERVRRELEIARQIQQSLLPTAQPSLAGMDIAGAVRAAEQAGGDYYGYIPLAGRKLGIVVADVSGHNVAAAIGMVITRCVMKIIAGRSPSPSSVVRRANSILCEDLDKPGLFVTAFYGVVDAGSGEVRFCNAGHHPPLLLRAATGEFETLRGGGPGLGIVEEARYRECRTRMETGDMLTIFTDGVLEAISPPGEMFGIERLKRLLMSLSGRPSLEVRDAVFDAIASFTETRAASDDTTVVVVRRDREAA